jgi:outer membrane protein insertion porin family
MRGFHLPAAMVALFLVTTTQVAQASWQPFVVEDIEVRGVERLAVGTVLNYLPVRAGEEFGPRDAQRAIRTLYETELFEDVELGREDNRLIVQVQERPAIGEVNIEGSFRMGEDELRAALRSIGLERGRIFNRSLLEQLDLELRRMFYGQGKYGMELETEVRELDRNRVAVDILLNEGRTARIRQITIIGNEAFDDDTLKGLMESGIRR